jgi:catechol 2,3-dioxygenase-like lactoylglutathione lyase family enzyme
MVIKSGLATIYVSDFERAFRFYTETLGLEPVHRAGDFWAQVKAPGGFEIGIHPEGTGPRAAGSSGSINVGFLVEEPLEDAVETLRARGAEFRGAIMEDDPVRIANFGDPDGNDLYLYSYRAES